MEVLQQMLERAQANPQRIVLPEGDEPRTLEAANIILRDKIANLILLGNPAVINKMAEEKVKINITIAGRNYPMTIDASKEELYRVAAKRLNEKISEYTRIPKIDAQDRVAMAALRFSILALNAEQSSSLGDQDIVELEKIEQEDHFEQALINKETALRIHEILHTICTGGSSGSCYVFFRYFKNSFH